MSNMLSSIFNHSDRVQMETLNHRMTRSQILNANIANSETPGYRAIGYDFEEQIQRVADLDNSKSLRTLAANHYKAKDVTEDGHIVPDVFVRPTESVGADGNTVDLDKELSLFAKNQILFRASVESINRKIALLRYAISGGE